MNKRPQSYGTMATPDVQFSGFSFSEFNSLCENVVTNIYTINSSWKTLESSLKYLGTSKDNQGIRDKIHVTQLSANQIVSVTSKDLNRLTVIVRKGEKKQKLQVETLTENFKDAVGKYSTLQTQVADKMKSHLLAVASMESSSAENSGLQQQVQMSRELAFEQELLIEREARVRQIEADVLDVNEIMRELGALVHQQGETIDTIENGIEHATGNVVEGTSELMKAAQYQSRYRRKLCYLVVIAFFIFALLVVVFLLNYKS